MFQPAGKNVHAALFWIHAHLPGGEFCWLGDGVREHPGRDARITEENTATFRCLQADVVDATKVAVRMIMNLVRRTRGVDVCPGLVLENEVRREVLRFSDTLAHLDNPQVDICKLLQILEIVGTLPAFYIGIGNANRILVAQLVDALE